MHLFKHSHQLSREEFYKLGHRFPKPEAATTADLQENIVYFRLELKRLGDSIAWISARPFTSIKSQFSIFFSVMDKVGCDANAQVLTSIMKTVLDQLDELACRVVQKKEEIEYMIIHVMDAVLQASIAVEPLCEDNLAAKAINKSMIETAMSDLQFYKKLHSKGREETFTETELKQAEEEANRARKIYREIEKEEMMQDGEK